MDHLPLPSSPQMGFILFCFDISASNPVNHQILIAFWQQAEMRGLNTDICPDNDMKREGKKNNMQHPPGVRERKQQGEVPSPHQRMLQILSEGSQRPWAVARLCLDCDTFGWCVLPRGRWTLFENNLQRHTHNAASAVLWREDVSSFTMHETDVSLMHWPGYPVYFSHTYTHSLISINYNHNTGPVNLTTTVWLQRVFKRGCMTCRWLVNREANYEAHDLNIINDTSITSLQAYDSNKIYEQG